MKQNMFKSVALAAVIVLTGAVFTSCGGGNGSNSDSSSDSQELATDGILGSFPQKYFECMDGINTARADLAVGTEQEREAAKPKLEELQEQLKTMAETEGLASIEIPTEVAEGIPFKVVKPLVITKVEDRQLTLEGEVESTEVVDQYKVLNYGYLVAYDKDGKPFTVGQHGQFAPENGKLDWAAGTKGKLTIYLSIATFNIEGLGRLGKLLIVDSKAEALKEAATAMSELQSAAMQKAREARGE